MRSVLITAIALVAITVASGDVARAGVKWCVVDPVLTVEGRLSDVQLAFDSADIPTLTGSTRFVFHVPSNTRANVVVPATPVPAEAEVRFDLQPWDGKSAIAVVVEATVSASARFATQTTVWRPGEKLLTKNGTSQTPTTMKYKLEP